MQVPIPAQLGAEAYLAGARRSGSQSLLVRVIRAIRGFNGLVPDELRPPSGRAGSAGEDAKTRRSQNRVPDGIYQSPLLWTDAVGCLPSGRRRATRWSRQPSRCRAQPGSGALAPSGSRPCTGWQRTGSTPQRPRRRLQVVEEPCEEDHRGPGWRTHGGWAKVGRRWEATQGPESLESIADRRAGMPTPNAGEDLPPPGASHLRSTRRMIGVIRHLRIQRLLSRVNPTNAFETANCLHPARGRRPLAGHLWNP